MDETMLVYLPGFVDNENEHTTWDEYRCRCHDEIVHRSVHVQLKKGIKELFIEAGLFGG